MAGQPVHKSEQQLRIVVSHCSADLHWLEEFLAGYLVASITIVSKCNQLIVGAPRQGECWGHLPNDLLTIRDDYNL